jgi:ribose 5-phosphate isomerase B
MKIAIGSDHAGFEMKDHLIGWLKRGKHEVGDFGTDSAESCDYPDIAHPVAEQVEEGAYQLGVILCGTANGTCMTANKHQGIRAALCWAPELSRLARAHNNANVLCLPARFMDLGTAEATTAMFLKTPFEGGRHEKRVAKIALDDYYEEEED